LLLTCIFQYQSIESNPILTTMVSFKPLILAFALVSAAPVVESENSKLTEKSEESFFANGLGGHHGGYHGGNYHRRNEGRDGHHRGHHGSNYHKRNEGRDGHHGDHHKDNHH
jgi:hypothetical protein